MAIKKDPPGMYSDLEIDQYEDLKRLSNEDLKGLGELMIKTDVDVDEGRKLEEEYQTYDIDRELLKQAIEKQIKKNNMSNKP